MKGVILCGGKGTRLSPLTDITNKHLLPIYNKPMILFPLETLKSLGVKDILIVTGGEYIGRFAEYLGDGSKFGVNLTYKVQKEANGIAGALGLAESFVGGDKVAVILGDNIFDNIIFFGSLEDNNACLYIKEVEDPERFGVVNLKEDRTIIEIEEKPKEPKSNLAVTGLYVYPPDVFDIIKTLKPSERGELEITDVNNYYIKEGRCKSATITGFWSDAGTFDSLLKSSNWIKENEN